MDLSNIELHEEENKFPQINKDDVQNFSKKMLILDGFLTVTSVLFFLDYCFGFPNYVYGGYMISLGVVGAGKNCTNKMISMKPLGFIEKVIQPNLENFGLCGSGVKSHFLSFWIPIGC